MKFSKAGWSSVNGTHLQGNINITYATLKRVFGKEHSDGDGYKVQAEWALKFADGTVATIYDYKEGKAYNGKGGKPKTKVTDWHIGGKSPLAVHRVEEAIQQAAV